MLANPPHRKRLHGFTLIELLVVISIIALLISILLPALKSAREVSRAAVCLSNLRQISIANFNYSTDFDGKVAPTRDSGFQSSPNIYGTTWNTRLTPYLTSTGSSWQTEYADSGAWFTTATIEFNRVWDGLECPSKNPEVDFRWEAGIVQTYAFVPGALTDGEWNAGYGLQQQTWTADGNRVRRVEDVTNSAKCVIYLESGDRVSWFWRQMWNWVYVLNAPPARNVMPDRHSEGTWNGSFVDGHAGALKQEDLDNTPDTAWKAILN